MRTHAEDATAILVHYLAELADEHGVVWTAADRREIARAVDLIVQAAVARALAQLPDLHREALQ